MVEMKNDDFEVTQVCKTLLEVIQSNDFRRWVEIVLKKSKKYETDYYLWILDKIRKHEKIAEWDKTNFINFLNDEDIRKLWVALLWRLKVNVNFEWNANDIYAWWNILNKLTKLCGYDRPKNELIKILESEH